MYVHTFKSLQNIEFLCLFIKTTKLQVLTRTPITAKTMIITLYHSTPLGPFISEFSFRIQPFSPKSEAALRPHSQPQRIMMRSQPREANRERDCRKEASKTRKEWAKYQRKGYLLQRALCSVVPNILYLGLEFMSTFGYPI